MATNPESNKPIPARDPLEIAILSFSSMEPAPVGSDIAGNELAKLRGFSAPLPVTDLTVQEWQIVMSEYISKGLDPTADSTRMLKYFDRQLQQAILKTQQQPPITTPLTDKESKNLSWRDIPLVASFGGMAFGALLTAITFMYEDTVIDKLYPGYTQFALEKRSQEYRQYPPPALAQWHVELEEIAKERNSIRDSRLGQNPLHNIGKNTFWAGLAGTVGFGSLSAGLSIFRRRSK